jgi:serine/threonine protein kinase/Flp pilus assembly protein TadD
MNDLNVRSIFGEALERSSAEERAAYLDETCRGDTQLRQRVEELLAAHEQAGGFLQGTGPSLAAALALAPSGAPGTLVGPYRLIELIGEGGMGVVFLAEQEQPVRRRVALKIIKPGMDSRQVIARFEAERQVLAMMDHPNIARILDAGVTGEGTRNQASAVRNQESGARSQGSGVRSQESSGQREHLTPDPCPLPPGRGRPFFVMELVHGVAITQYCDDHCLTPHERLGLFIDVCQAVQHAHQKGIIHRDIKPSNVLVTLPEQAESGASPVVKVIDFGVAKAMGQRLTEQTIYTGVAQIVGTPPYMSPEQAAVGGLDIDTRSDIYSLGVLLYELLTGTTPFDRQRLRHASYDEMRRIIREEEPLRPSAQISTLGQRDTTVCERRHSDPRRLSQAFRGELDWIVMKCLEKEPNRRYETAGALALDLRRYLRDEPVHACPPSAMYRLRKFARRNKPALAVAAVVFLALLTLAGSIGWQMRGTAARLSATELQVDLAAREADQLRAQGSYMEALLAAKRAEALAANGGSEALRARGAELRKDLEMVLRLEEIRLPRAREGKELDFDHAWADDSYAEAFAEYGIDVDSLEAAEAAECIRARAIWLELATALDCWARQRHTAKKPGWPRLIAVARLADPDEWRNQVRDALERGDQETLRKLASSPRISGLPLPTLSLLGGAIKDDRANEAVLRQAQRKYPHDFWINFQLAWTLERAQPPQLNDAVRFYTAALTLRPQNVPIYMWLGNALFKHGTLDEADAMYRRYVELNPKHAAGHYWLGQIRARQGKLDEALAAFRKAIEREPRMAGHPYNVAHLVSNLGTVFHDQGKLPEAAAAFRYALELKPDEPGMLCNLGRTLQKQGDLAEALVHLKRGHELGSRDAKWAHPSGKWVKDCEEEIEKSSSRR